MPNYITLPQFCRKVGINPSTMYRWMKDERWTLDPVKRGNRNLFDEAKADAEYERLLGVQPT